MIKSGTTHLGQYRLGAELGSGGMGIVYRATDETLHREVAMKVLHPHLLQDEDLKERFRREARMHAQLMHPNVVTLLSIYEDGEHMALIMEMVQGKNLREYLRAANKQTMADLLRIAQAILSGLQAAHQLGLVHRDLKPANVLLSDSGDVKLMDFGLAKPAAGDDDLTQSGATVGSFRYMSPEQILNQPIDARTDLYAFGILLYQMVTGKLPFDASAQNGGEFEIMEKQVRELPVAPHEINHSLPLDISDLILRLLAKSPDDRPASCTIVQQEITEISMHLSDQLVAPSLAKSAPTMVIQSNTAIAKGLVEASAKGVVNFGSTLFGSFIAIIPSRHTLASHWDKQLSSPHKKLLAWGGGALLVTILIWIMVAVMGDDSRSSIVKEPVAPSDVSMLEKSSLNVEATPEENVKDPQGIKESIVDPVKSTKQDDEKPVEKVQQTKKDKPTVKPNRIIKPKRVERSITYTVPHKVMRSTGGQVDINQPHEFKGGNHVYFEVLRDYSGKDSFTSYKKGQIRLYLDEAVSLKKIILKKASVGKLNFKGGYVKLAVQDDKYKWHKVFFREDDDVDIAVTIAKNQLPAKIKGVRLRFRTPEPITIGPIDLIH